MSSTLYLSPSLLRDIEAKRGYPCEPGETLIGATDLAQLVADANASDPSRDWVYVLNQQGLRKYERRQREDVESHG